MFKVVAKNTLAQGFGKIFTVILSLITTAILTRFLKGDGYGSYVFITAFVLLFGSVADWGTNITAVRKASQSNKEQPIIFGSILLFRLILALASVLLFNFVIRLNPLWQNIVGPATAASLVLVALSLKTSFNIIFQTKLRFEFSSIVEVLSSSTLLLGVALSYFLNKGLNEVMGFWVVSACIAAAVSYYFASRISPISWTIDKRIIANVFTEALPAGALLLVFSVYNRIDVLILDHFRDKTSVGAYGLAYKVYDNLVLGAAFLMNSLFPILASLYSKKNFLSLRAYYLKTFDILLSVGLVVSATAWVFAPIAVRLLGSGEFPQSVGVLRILVFAILVAYLNHLTGFSLLAFGKQKASLIIALIALLFNILSNWIFIPLYSYKAAAVITIATEGLVLVLSSVVVWKTIGVFPTLFSFPKTLVLLIKTKGKSFSDEN